MCNEDPSVKRTLLELHRLARVSSWLSRLFSRKMDERQDCAGIPEIRKLGTQVAASGEALPCPGPRHAVALEGRPMTKRLVITCIATVSIAIFIAMPAAADSVFFSTGNPDGLIGTLSRPASAGKIQTETADDFILSHATMINQATFTGLLPSGAALSSIADVEIEIYHVFPTDSANPPSGNVPTRVNSPADVEIASATRDRIAGSLSYTPSLLNSHFSVANTVVTGINKKPNQFTGGEGPATGEEVQISVIFNQPIVLGADHYFFRPEVQLTNGDFLWLSAPKPIVPPGTPFSPDLQSWIRNDNLAPDWLRIGTDITHQGPFNASFSLTGTTVPEPSTLLLLGTGLLALVGFTLKKAIA